MSDFNFPLFFIAAITIVVSAVLLIFTGLPVWASFLTGFAAAIVGILAIDLVIILVEKRQKIG